MAVTVGEGAVVCQAAELIGSVTIGSGAVLHPKCRIDGSKAPVTIGAGTIIEENVQIVAGGEALVIGDNCLIAVATVMNDASAGAGNRIGPLAQITEGTRLGDYNFVGARCTVGPASNGCNDTEFSALGVCARAEGRGDVDDLHQKLLAVQSKSLQRHHTLRPAGSS